MERRAYATGKDWITKVAEHLLGKISTDDLYNAAAGADPVNKKRLKIEASFYAGIKKLFSGDKAGAIELLRNCQSADAKDLAEAALAEMELKLSEAQK
jgi:lipoprotein NlpI